MEINNNEVLTPFEELSKLLENIYTQLETISSKFDGVAEAMKPIKDISNEMSKIQLSDILGIGAFILDMTGLALTSAEMTLTISNSVEDIIDELSDGRESVRKLSKQLGRDIGKGIAEGMKDSIATIKMATSVICDKGIIAEFKAEMEINSPSKVMKRIASSIPEGIVDAIKDGQAGIKKAMGNSVEVIEDASKKMSKLKFGLGGLAAVTAIVVPLIDYFVNMMSTNETLSAKMEEIWVKICINVTTLVVV